jgi:WhiB family redox-sensing transcriptional regulator
MPWAADAACRGLDPNLFLPERGDRNHEAVAVCHGCEVREACLEYAIEHRAAGVWGGTSERERRRIRGGW